NTPDTPTAAEPSTEPPATEPSRAPLGMRFPRGAWWLVACSVALVAVSLGSYFILVRNAGVPHTFDLVWWLFDVGREYNIATWFNSLLWVMLAGLAALGMALTHRRWSWGVLALVATVASIDEFAELHERLDVFGIRIAERLGIDLWFTWVLAAIPIVIVIVLALLPLALALPVGQLVLLVAGGAIFLLGALGLETLSGMDLRAAEGLQGDTYVWITAFEELFELVGISVAIGALAGLYEWHRRDGALDIRFRGWRTRTVAA
ncbi:MAG: hypothetical protein Q4G64_08840, partial [bacterium]|nr:hypothetical protein [bacterium]